MEAHTVKEISKKFSLHISCQDANQMNPLNLAYMGDVVYEIYIRRYLILSSNKKVNELNKNCVKFVKATAQSEAINSLMEELTADEIKIVKRGRNASPKTVPKNTNLIDYKMATGFESLLGYLYLTDSKERLEYIIEKAIIKTLATNS